MKKKKLLSALALALALVCAFSLGATASNGIQAIQANLDSTISVKLNGETQILKDAQGSRIYPITYQGSTYLPVRAVAELTGLGVDWDQATKSVLLGKQPGGVDLIDTYKIYFKAGKWAEFDQVQTSEKKTEDIAGVTYSNWIYLETGKQNLGTITDSISYNLLGRHETLTFSCYSTKDVTVKVLGDEGALLGEYTFTGGAVPKTVTVPLIHTNELKFQVDTPPHLSLRIFDAYLDAE